MSWAGTPVGCIYCHNRDILLRYNDSLLLYNVDWIFNKIAFSFDAFCCCCCFLLYYIRPSSILFVIKTPLVVKAVYSYLISLCFPRTVRNTKNPSINVAGIHSTVKVVPNFYLEINAIVRHQHQFVVRWRQ